MGDLIQLSMRLTFLLLLLLALVLISECRRKTKPPGKKPKPPGKKPKPPGKKPKPPAKKPPGKKPLMALAGGTWPGRIAPSASRGECSVDILFKTNATKNIPPRAVLESKGTL